MIFVPSPIPTSITVATYNVHYICKSPSNQLVLNNIIQSNADIISLQEVNEDWETFFTTATTSPASDGNANRTLLTELYPHVRFHNPTGNKWAGYAILSKHPIDQWVVNPETDRGWYPSGCITIRVPNQNQAHPLPSSQGQNEQTNFYMIQLLVVHLRASVEWSSEPYWWGGHADWIGGYLSKSVKRKRLNEIQTFGESLDPVLPTIVMGDFNEDLSSSPCLEYLKSGLGMAVLGKVNRGGWLGSENWFGRNCFTNSWSFDPCFSIPLLAFDYDHIAYSPGLLECVDNVATIHQDSRGSDHRLVSASFRFVEQ
mmetsp:Transcript_65565/g.77064  ORF Transcript_65565/g.77064 Transcript_65565/m.77064 type:complete len:313 (+) Transcript_65565:52-990(+)